jgi:hypothetical protein
MLFFIYNPCFGCLQNRAYNNTYITQQDKSMKIRNLRTTIRSVHTKIRIVFTQGDNKTYNLITVPHHCKCHRPRPRRILPCLGPYRWSHLRPTKKNAWRHKWTSKRDIRHLLILQMEQLKVGTNELPSVAKKKVTMAAASVSSTEAFPTVGLPF